MLGIEYLNKFKVYHQVTLFPPNWEALKEHRCPLCSKKLKFTRNNEMAICSSNKHRKNFIIGRKKLIELAYQ